MEKEEGKRWKKAEEEEGRRKRRCDACCISIRLAIRVTTPHYNAMSFSGHAIFT